jgi:cell division protein ZipA
MDNLRLILIVAGMIVIAAIYLWDRIQNRNLSRRQTIHAGEGNKVPMHPLPAAENDDDLAAELSNLNDFLTGATPDEQDSAGQGPVISRSSIVSQDELPLPGPVAAGEQDYAVADPAPEDVIALYIVAPKGQYLAGGMILAVLSDLGFEFGAMDIFHHHGAGHLRGDQPLFSLVNMYEPGYFDINDMNGFSTAGLSVFMRLPGARDGEETFTYMLEITRRLAAKLGAEVYGPDRQPLNPDTIRQIVLHIKEYGR